MENFTGLPFLAPKKVVGKEGKEVWEIQWNNSPSLSLPMIAAVRDTGAFITPILFHPDRYEGMNFHIAEKFYSLSEITRILKEKTGKNVVYKQIEAEEFKKKLPNIAEQAIWEAFTYPEEFGYFGSEGEETTRWAREQGVGELQSFEEFLDENPLVLS